MARVTLATTAMFALAVALASSSRRRTTPCGPCTSAHYEVARDTGDKLRRFLVFKETACSVYARHPGDRHYVLGLNSFADMTTEEFRDSFTRERPAVGGERHVDASGERHFNITPQAEGDKLLELPDAVDWRTKDATATPAVESLNAIKRNIGLVDLSPQELVDCCDREKSGCNGGFAVKAF
ncbi:vignain-like [Panicum virgatum]|uniref:vignain-like n=1 Tax=Panicum virgatum TaxID=38727 RepID=UPI0019D642D4|nr:vignain-like [Panicum virgatum]